VSDQPTAAVDPTLRRWAVAGVAALAVIVLSVPVYLVRRSLAGPGVDFTAQAPTFVGLPACARCHEQAVKDWRGSDHDKAMAEATPETVLGDFNDATFTRHGMTSRFFRRDDRFFVSTEGPDGAITEYEIAYTFGHDPLQQYLVRFPGGRLQALSLCWDVPRRRWFHVYGDQRIPPGDWLHWTRNAQNWNGMCAECHSTNLRKGYDPDSDAYTTTWSEINVSCEACHGPGSRHVAWADLPPMARPATDNYGLAVRNTGLDGPRLVELCAPCHSRRAELGDYDHSSTQLLDHMLPSLLDEGLYFADGQLLDEVYEYGSYLQSKMYQRGIKCSDCHDVHSLKLRFDGNRLCLQCHQGQVYDSADHHFHKKTVDGRPSDGALCVKCHMMERPYMQIDWRADHSFRVPRPDLTAALGTPNACAQGGCHADKPLAWLLEAQRRWYGQARKPHYGTTLAAGRTGTPGARPELIRLARDPLQPAIVRATALTLLDRYPASDSSAALRESLLAPEALLRRTAIATLALPDPAERAKLFAPLLSDPVRVVRMAAVSALAGIPLEQLKPFQRDAFEKAVAEYRSSMAYTLDFPSSAFNLGNLESALGHAVEAERFYRLAIRIDDLFFPAKLNLAVLLSGQGRNAEAEQVLRAAVAAYPNDANTSYMLGLLLVEQGKVEEAVAALRQATRADPRFARAHYNLGLLLDRLGRTGEAEDELRRAAEVEPLSFDYLYALAEFYARRGRVAEARAATERLLTAHPDNPTARELAAFLERSGPVGAGR
jgi:tetratricopeptide (TPR) repeat protein